MHPTHSITDCTTSGQLSKRMIALGCITVIFCWCADKFQGNSSSSYAGKLLSSDEWHPLNPGNIFQCENDRLWSMLRHTGHWANWFISWLFCTWFIHYQTGKLMIDCQIDMTWRTWCVVWTLGFGGDTFMWGGTGKSVDWAITRPWLSETIRQTLSNVGSLRRLLNLAHPNTLWQIREGSLQL